VTGTWAVIPLKPFGNALGRLARVLGREERRRLQEAMLADVLGACGGAKGLDETVIVTGDPHGAALARGLGATVVDDHRPPRGMDAAVDLGLAAASDAGARAALVLFTDLALVRAADLDALLAAAPEGRGATLVPSRDGEGTNALLLAPPRVLQPRLGGGSLAGHLARARDADVPVTLVPVPAIALDIDTPDDLAAYWAAAPPGATREACADLRVGERVAAVGAPR
jgi:2-phospho-L-lactate guanylyltransferase